MSLDVEVYERLAALEANMATQTAALIAHIKSDEAHQRVVEAGLRDISERLSKQKGFVAGVVFVVTAIAGTIGLLAKFWRP